APTHSSSRVTASPIAIRSRSPRARSRSRPRRPTSRARRPKASRASPSRPSRFRRAASAHHRDSLLTPCSLTGGHRVPRPELPLDLPRDVHRAELGPTHRAELGALEVFGGQRFVVQLTRPRGIERQPELFVPVERVPRARSRVVAVPG